MGCKGSKQATATEGTAAPPTSKILKEAITEESATIVNPETKILKEDANDIEIPVIPDFDLKIVLERKASEATGIQHELVEDMFILVKGVAEEGLIPSWNLKNVEKPEVQIKEGDLIVDVNGISCDADKMLEQMLQKLVCILVQRSACDEEAVPLAPDELVPETPADVAVEEKVDVDLAEVKNAEDDTVAPILADQNAAVDMLVADEQLEDLTTNDSNKQICTSCWFPGLTS